MSEEFLDECNNLGFVIDDEYAVKKCRTAGRTRHNLRSVRHEQDGDHRARMKNPTEASPLLIAPDTGNTTALGLIEFRGKPKVGVAPRKPRTSRRTPHVPLTTYFTPAP